MKNCEGCEFDLLEPRNDPILLRTDILVEIHSEHGDKRQIHEFRDTHDVTEIQAVPRTISDAPDATRCDVLSAMSEGRSDQTWLFLQLKRRWPDSAQDPIAYREAMASFASKAIHADRSLHE
jgi:hypothetical protein